MPTDSINLIGRRIRPEARPISWTSLNLSQKEAFRRIVYTIDEALSAILSNGNNLPPGALIHPNRASNALFLSGERGTGKTSMLLTLMQLQQEQSVNHADGDSDRYRGAKTRLNKNVIWLEPIDMDPLPQPFSLLTTILERVRQATNRSAGQTKIPRALENELYSSGFSSNEMELLEEFNSLYTDATLAWDSNIGQRSSGLYPDDYASELSRTNKARLSLNQRMDKCLSNLARLVSPSITNPLFVVTIDDFDMHPSSALHVLKLLRMLSPQRLFFLMLGDMDMLELMADLSVSRELNSLIPETSRKTSLGFDLSQVGQAAGAISRTTLRKVLPPQQRMFVQKPTIIEGMGFRPANILSASTPGNHEPQLPSLLTLLGNVPFLAYCLHANEQTKQLDNSPFGKKKESFEERAALNKIGGFHVFSMLGYLFNGGLAVTEALEDVNSLPMNWSKINPLKDPYVDIPAYFSDFHTYTNDDPRSGSSPLELAFQAKGLKHLGKLKGRGALHAANVADRELKEKRFWGIEIFRASPRVLGDLWFLLRLQADEVTRSLNAARGQSTWEKLKTESPETIDELFRQFETSFLTSFSRFCRNLLLEETAFASSQREMIAVSFESFSYGDYSWAELPIRVVAVTEPVRTIPTAKFTFSRTKVPILEKFPQRVRRLYSEVRVAKVRDWSMINKDLDVPTNSRLGTESETISKRATAKTESANQGDPGREISRPTAASVMLLHDFMTLGTKSTQFESSLLPRDDGTLNALRDYSSADDAERLLEQTRDEIWCRWAGVRYKGSYSRYADLYFPPPTVLSFWGLDMFRRHWNQAVTVAEGINDEREKLERLAYEWTIGGCAVIDGKPLPKQSSGKIGQPPRFGDWERLCVRLNRIAKDYLESKHLEQVEVTRRIRRWLQNVVVMMMPESGLPSHLMFQALFGIEVEHRQEVRPNVLVDTDSTIDFYWKDNLAELGEIESSIKRHCARQLAYFFLDLKEEQKTKGKDSTRKKFVRLFNEVYSEIWVPTTVSTSDLSNPESTHRDTSTTKSEAWTTILLPERMKQLLEKLVNRTNAQSYEDTLREIEITLGIGIGPEIVEFNVPSLLRDWFINEYRQLLSGTYLARFIKLYKTEIRARRGVRLGMLGNIAGGSFLERMLRFNSIHLAERRKHSEYDSAYGKFVRSNSSGVDSTLGKTWLERSGVEDTNVNIGFDDLEYGFEASRSKDFTQRWTLGHLFDGGGLVPHCDEIPGMQTIRDKHTEAVKNGAEEFLAKLEEEKITKDGIQADVEKKEVPGEQKKQAARAAHGSEIERKLPEAKRTRPRKGRQ
ncbi:hypothetical protein [Rhodopirellula bahusiensis]|uniref:hypothetical protein n=5 Tax=Rhodopirellula bahusiensis TaxID=2014065 RepID=UPI003264C601